MVDVPTSPATVIPTAPTRLAPAMPMHATDVAVVQLLVEQSASASTAVTVASVGAKSMPVRVTLATIAYPTLYGDDVVITGADHATMVDEKVNCTMPLLKAEPQR